MLRDYMQFGLNPLVYCLGTDISYTVIIKCVEIVL